MKIFRLTIAAITIGHCFGFKNVKCKHVLRYKTHTIHRYQSDRADNAQHSLSLSRKHPHRQSSTLTCTRSISSKRIFRKHQYNLRVSVGEPICDQQVGRQHLAVDSRQQTTRWLLTPKFAPQCFGCIQSCFEHSAQETRKRERVCV